MNDDGPDCVNDTTVDCGLLALFTKYKSSSNTNRGKYCSLLLCCSAVCTQQQSKYSTSIDFFLRKTVSSFFLLFFFFFFYFSTLFGFAQRTPIAPGVITDPGGVDEGC